MSECLRGTGVRLNLDAELRPPAPLGLTDRPIDSSQTLKLLCSTVQSCYQTGVLPPADAPTESLINTPATALLLMPGAAGLEPITAGELTTLTLLNFVFVKQQLVNFTD